MADRTHGAFVPDANDIVRHGRLWAKEEIERLASHAAKRQYDAEQEAIQEVAVCYFWRTFTKLRWGEVVHKWERLGPTMFDIYAPTEKHIPLPEHKRLLARIVAVLETYGALVRTERGWRLADAVPAWMQQDPDALAARVMADFPDNTEIVITRNCGNFMPEVLTGAKRATEVIFTDPAEPYMKGKFKDRIELITAMYTYTPATVLANTMVKHCCRRVIEEVRSCWKRGRRTKLRIAEIGGGTGGTTRHVLPIIGAGDQHAEYLFTDIGQTFINNFIREMRGTYPFLIGKHLDIEHDPAAQGVKLNHYDMMVAVNVLHATKDMRVTMANVLKMLTSRGVLVLMEGIIPEDRDNTKLFCWLDCVFGLTDGWWRFTDFANRTNYAMMPYFIWERVLYGVGFEKVDIIYVDMGISGVIVAQAPAKDASYVPKWVPPANADVPRYGSVDPAPRGTLSPAPDALLKGLESALAGMAETKDAGAKAAAETALRDALARAKACQLPEWEANMRARRKMRVAEHALARLT